MKTKAILIAFVMYSALLGCTKKTNVTLNETLTNCPANSTCTYNYTEHADFDKQQQLISGNYRVFTDVNTNANGITEQLNFKTSLSNNDFIISSNQIASGQLVTFNVICIACNTVLRKPVGGEIKGKKTDATHWLINASVILGNSYNNHVDTLKIVQYFTMKNLN